ncbi:hypothetical protein CAL29_26205 [Bordetella genomosp. 10]|uniref:DUF3318 domain-containing protein n=1 Tax=Bordetella genomosp. 10 TaxID=1416804 RepID=A0A261S225_9BORD|nr:hypothetical protein [Bordetella genomosp. 10]OZI31404.1 hypothetical protein CAL29_26205 [Bordetella genomosp. 10]
MSKKLSPAVDRAVRLELLRAKAAVEREALVHNLAEAGVALSPSHLLRSVLPGSLQGLASGGSSKLAWQAFNLLRRYPMVMSSVSALVMGGSKKSKLLKLAAGALVGWQALRVWREKHQDDERAGPVDGGV